MMRTTRTFQRAAGATGAIAILAAGVVATQATGDSPKPVPRAEAVLAATQAELSDTQHRVSEIRLEHVIDGREVYALSGPDTSCVLVAGEDQEAGKSQSLACTNAALADPQRPLRTGFATTAGGGYVDLVWVGGDAPSQIARTGAAADVRIGTEVVASVRNDDSTGSVLRWQGAADEPVTVELPSRAERAALVPGE